MHGPTLFVPCLCTAYYSSLHAKESKDIVANACIHGRIDEEFSGGYIAFLMRVGLPVDRNDPDVTKEVNDPSLHSMQGKSKHEIDGK